MEWFALGDMPAMIAGGEIRAASTSAAVLMIGRATGGDLTDGSAKVKLPLGQRAC
jgi:hypothetical protein